MITKHTSKVIICQEGKVVSLQRGGEGKECENTMSSPSQHFSWYTMYMYVSMCLLEVAVEHTESVFSSCP